MFGPDNLDIAGSAIGPTGGASPPPLTIVALMRRCGIRPLALPGAAG